MITMNNPTVRPTLTIEVFHNSQLLQFFSFFRIKFWNVQRIRPLLQVLQNLFVRYDCDQVKDIPFLSLEGQHINYLCLRIVFQHLTPQILFPHVHRLAPNQKLGLQKQVRHSPRLPFKSNQVKLNRHKIQ